MKKIWKFIVDNRIYIVLVLFVLFGAFVFVTMKAYLDPEDELAVYGNRLEGIEKVSITRRLPSSLTAPISIISFIKPFFFLQ